MSSVAQSLMRFEHKASRWLSYDAADRCVQFVEGDITPAMLAAFTNAGVVSADTETTGLDPATSRLALVQLFSPEYGAVVVRPDRTYPRALVKLFEDERVTKVFHHAMFDLRFLRHEWCVRARNVVCTKVMSKLLDPSGDHREHSLAPLVQRHLGVLLDKSMQTSDWSSEELSQEQLRYAVRDVLYLVDLAMIEFKMVSDAGLSDLATGTFEFLPTRVEMMELGVPDVLVH
jgi:ribonuclease D